jgi:TonB family protein
MKRLKGVLIAAGLLSSAFLSAFARDVKVIANASIKTDSISAAELKGIFLEEKISLGDGTHVEPVNEKDGAVHQGFLQQYLGKTAEDLQTYYRTLVFTGKASMPKELGSDAEVVAYVARTRGAIGYVGAETNTDGVKTLTIIRSESGGERKLLTRIEPNYPDTLKRLNIGGTVRLNVTIAPKGNVEKVEVLGGNPILGESAMRAVKQWIYSSSHSRTTLEVSIPFDSRQ